MRHGRVFFMGDAAKVVSPFGARGGNTGIADADNLAWKLAAVLQGPRRARAAGQLSRGTARGGAAERAGDQPHRPLPAAGRRHGESLPRCGRWAWHGSTCSRGSWSTPAAWPSPILTRSSSACEHDRRPVGAERVVRVARRLHGHSERPAAVGRRRLAPAAVRRHQRRQPAAAARLGGSAPVRCVQVLGAGRRRRVPWSMCATRKAHLQGACHVFGHAWALIRPDSYVAATGETVDADLVHAVRKALGVRRPEEEAA